MNIDKKIKKMNVDRNLGNSIFSINVSPLYTKEVYDDPVLYEKMNHIFSYCKLHISIICTNSKYSNILKYYAENYSTIDELLFFVIETKIINQKTYDLFLDTKNKEFKSSIELLRKSPLRSLFKSEYYSKSLLDSDIFCLRIISENALSKEDTKIMKNINKYVYALRAKTIFFKEFDNNIKTYEYTFV